MSRRKQDDSPVDEGRRQLLIGSGLLGAAATVAPGLLWAQRGGRGGGRWSRNGLSGGDVDWTVEQLTAALEALRNDTFYGVVAMVVPGNDPYSQVQGVSTQTPGGIGTRADLYLAGAVDRLVPTPPDYMQQLLSSVGSYLARSPLEIPDSVGESMGPNQEWILENLDYTLGSYFEQGVANSIFTALLLNLGASRLNANALDGQFVAPFSNLSWDQKVQVFAELDGERSQIKRAIEWRISDQAYRDATAGVLQSIISFLMRIGAWGSYNEFAVFDPETLTIAQRPLGWVLSNYQPSAPPVADGWDDFIGYYQGRRAV